MKTKILWGIAFWKIAILQWEIITRGNGTPYLTRFTIIKTPWFGLFIHWFQDSDDECLHDHPWSFLTYVVTVGYWNITDKGKEWVAPGNLRFRPRPHKHRVQIPEKGTPITVVLIGPTRRKWGFHTLKGWIHHRDYEGERDCP